jgi:hypothetical protein
MPTGADASLGLAAERVGVGDPRMIIRWCVCLFGLIATVAHGQAASGEAAIHSSYIDIGAFNERFSAEPVIQLTIAVELGEGFYVEPYLYTGMSAPFADESSEYGVEFGWEGSIAPGMTGNLAAGRWANYAGQGFRNGDWFGRAGIKIRDLNLSATVVSGVTGTLLLNAEYRMRPVSSITMIPSLAYVTADAAFNPGIELMYAIAPQLGATVRLAAPSRPEGREVFGSIGLSWSFGGE